LPIIFQNDEFLRKAGNFVSDFRELETPPMARTKDVVLMATVSSFEHMSQPGRHELKQFAELFEPVFKASSLEARRNSIAALSRCPSMPQSVMWFISTQPIELAAIFLTSSPAIDDDMLIAVSRTQGPAYAKAVAARDNLSVKVVDALVALHQGLDKERSPAPAAEENRSQAELLAAAREEEMRQTLKSLVHRDTLVRSEETPEDDELMQQALLVRFARLRDAHNFSTTLADTLGASRWLSHRILLDLSGLQLATALIAMGITPADGEFILTQFYPHLKERAGEWPRAAMVWSGLDAEECADRVRIWIRADDYTQGKKPDDHAANANETVPEVAAAVVPAQRQAFGRRKTR
jgi:uncharacterized protein (DUF2336 family)